jgi:hypothetical protein
MGGGGKDATDLGVGFGIVAGGSAGAAGSVFIRT